MWVYVWWQSALYCRLVRGAYKVCCCHSDPRHQRQHPVHRFWGAVRWRIYQENSLPNQTKAASMFLASVWLRWIKLKSSQHCGLHEKKSTSKNWKSRVTGICALAVYRKDRFHHYSLNTDFNRFCWVDQQNKMLIPVN